MPIAFAPTYPVNRDAITDLPSPAKTQGISIDNNFKLINANISKEFGPSTTVIISTQKSFPSVKSGTWALGSAWPAFTFTLPARVSAVHISVVVYLRSGDERALLALIPVLTGSGLDARHDEGIVYSQSTYGIELGSQSILNPAWLRPGGNITCTPNYSSSLTSTNLAIANGHIYVTILR